MDQYLFYFFDLKNNNNNNLEAYLSNINDVKNDFVVIIVFLLNKIVFNNDVFCTLLKHTEE